MRNLQYLVVLGALSALTACGGSQQEEETTPVTVAAEPAPVEEEAAVAEDPDDVHIEGDHLVVDRRIHFASDEDTILEDSFDLLDHIATLIANHQAEISHLQVIGHTDAAGGHAHNQDLSERRAAAVVAALQERGVAIQLDPSGVGETEPTCEEDTDECHAQNRRVEFVIVQN